MHIRSPTSRPFFLHKTSKHLDDDCYFPTEHKPGLFGPLTLQPTFNLVVGNFGTKIVGKHNSDHLINTFKNITTSLLIGMVKPSVELS